jgi:hypothetical protein
MQSLKKNPKKKVTCKNKEIAITQTEKKKIIIVEDEAAPLSGGKKRERLREIVKTKIQKRKLDPILKNCKAWTYLHGAILNSDTVVTPCVELPLRDQTNVWEKKKFRECRILSWDMGTDISFSLLGILGVPVNKTNETTVPDVIIYQWQLYHLCDGKSTNVQASEAMFGYLELLFKNGLPDIDKILVEHQPSTINTRTSEMSHALVGWLRAMYHSQKNKKISITFVSPLQKNNLCFQLGVHCEGNNNMRHHEFNKKLVMQGFYYYVSLLQKQYTKALLQTTNTNTNTNINTNANTNTNTNTNANTNTQTKNLISNKQKQWLSCMTWLDNQLKRDDYCDNVMQAIAIFILTEGIWCHVPEAVREDAKPSFTVSGKKRARKENDPVKQGLAAAKKKIKQQCGTLQTMLF